MCSRPAYEYQFGEWLRPDIERGNLPQPAADPDLALLFWQARSHSLPLFGEPAERLIPPVPFSRVRQAIYGALPSLLDNLEGDERNVLLTLARMWYTLSTGGLGSKDQAAEWAAARLPEPFSAPLCWPPAPTAGKPPTIGRRKGQKHLPKCCKKRYETVENYFLWKGITAFQPFTQKNRHFTLPFLTFHPIRPTLEEKASARKKDEYERTKERSRWAGRLEVVLVMAAGEVFFIAAHYISIQPYYIWRFLLLAARPRGGGKGDDRRLGTA